MCLWLLASWASAASLAEYMDAAVRNQPRAAIAGAGVEVAKADVAQAGGALLPTVRGNASWTLNQYEALAVFPDPEGGPPQEIIIVPKSQYQASLNLRVPLLDGPSWARWRGLGMAAEAVASDERSIEQALRLEVGRAYYAAAAAQELVAVAERSKQAADEDVRYLAARSDAGAATSLAVQRAELEAANADLFLLDCRHAAMLARRALATLSGLPEPDALPSVASVDAAPPASEAALLAAAEERRPEIAAANERVRQQRAAASAVWLAFAPTVAGVASEQITNASGFSGQNTSWRVGLELDWPLLDVGSRSADLRRARAALAVAEANLQQALDTAKDEVHAAYLTVETARARVSATRRGATVGRATAEETRARFQAGTATQVEVIQADRDALDAEVKRISAEGTLAVARLALLRAAGDEVRP